MFTLGSTIAAIFLAALSHKHYRFIALLVAFEFIAHKITYHYFFLELRSENSSLIYVLYIFIQASALLFMYIRQTHFMISLLVFSNLFYNFFMVLQFIHITEIDFYKYKAFVIRPIMILELLYLAGVSSYFTNFLKKHRYPDIDYIDGSIVLWRNNFFISQYNRIRMGAIKSICFISSLFRWNSNGNR